MATVLERVAHPHWRQSLVAVDKMLPGQQIVARDSKGKGIYCNPLMDNSMTQLRSHLPYGITQCYLLPDTSEHTPPAMQAGTRFTYPGGMEG